MNPKKTTHPVKWMGIVLIFLSLAALACLTPAELTPIPKAIPPQERAQQAESAAKAGKGATQIQEIAISADGEEALLVDLYQRINPAVVHIRVYDSSNFPLGSGSGFVVDDQKHVITNNHVVIDADKIEIVFWDATRVRGEVIGSDADADLAVLEAQSIPAGVAPLTLADSNALQVGQRVVAIGTPFGLQGTMTVGIISGLDRRIDSQRTFDPTSLGAYSNPDVIQTDAAINPGNSGGPLLNSEGQVIGINTAIRSDTGTNSGVGFASPINTAAKLLPHLIEKGFYVYPWLGVTGRTEIDLFTMEELGLPQSQGVLVTEVVTGGPSDQAGLRPGDFITQIDSQPLTDFSDLISYLVSDTEPGQQVELTLIRNGRTLELPLTLGERP